ncbi:ATP-dependent rRNA helicase spb4 [Mortierella sp. GBA30]|nr:ATP-dependent rRNA helicase spb4 [Mortierella sp. GBA30]
MTSVAPAGSWESLDPKLSPEVLDAVSTMGFSDMTPVQSGAIPLFMKNKDVVVEAVTGSGKTLSFLIPILEKIHRRSRKLAPAEVGAIVISPTRELATQITKVLKDFEPFFQNISHQLLIGGETSLEEDIATFQEVHPDILIGTPGRLEDILSQKRSGVNVKELEVLVLDEADRLLDMGFSVSLNKIMSLLPKQRRTGLFSATMTDGLHELVRAGLRNPVRVVVKVEDLVGGGGQRTPASLHIGYILCSTSQKLLLLTHLLRQESANKKTIVYFATCASVDYFYKLLSRHPALSDFAIHSLHGKMETKKRSLTFKSFTDIPAGSPGILLCTDVASRGLDIPDVDFVVQVDPPQDPKAFTHRCGRAGRAGREGKAIVFLVRGKEETYVDFLKVRKVPIQRWAWRGGPIITTAEEEEDEDQEMNTANANDEEDEKLLGKIIRVEPEDDEENAAFLKGLRKIVMTDRDLHDKGTMAYVSFIRSYSKHEASFIFRSRDLDLGALARGYGLLRLPKMPELKNEKSGGGIEGFVPADIDMDKYKYQDKQKEAVRVKKLAEYKAKQAEKEKQAALNGGQNNDKKRKAINKASAWSEKQEAKERKLERQLKKQRKRDYLKRVASGEIKEGDGKAKDGENEEDEDEDEDNSKKASGSSGSKDEDEDEDEEDSWEALAREERLAKKVKKGKMSSKDFDKQVGNMFADL